MKVLYISNWSINDPLTISSVMPTLPALKRHLGLDRITLVTVERNDSKYPRYEIPYEFVDHIGLVPRGQWSYVITKAYEMLVLPRKVEKICREQRVDLIFARCSMAGTMAQQIHARTGAPFIVESFEPHSDYMVNCGAWTKGWKYKYARGFERAQMATARMLITVSENYRDYLVAVEGVDKRRIEVIPCVTDLEQTKFDPVQRTLVRAQLGLGEAVTAVYSGKFGGLYYDREAFRVIRDAFDYFKDFRVLLLTPTDPGQIQAHMKALGIPESRVHIRLVPRREVPNYLSAADFAYSFHRPNPASPFLSPIKHGEYWACGLPFIAPDNIGDDSGIISREGGGANLNHDLTNIRECHEAVSEIMAAPDYRSSMRGFAVRYKSAGIIDDVFSRIFG